jgi:hypothetical protein
MAKTKTVQEENIEVQNELDTVENEILTDDVNSIILEDVNEQKQTEALETKTLLRNSGGLETMANELANYTASTVGSEMLKFFVEVPTDTTVWGTKAYHMALLLAESNQIDAGVEEEDVPDVTVKTAGHYIKSYKKQFSHSGVYLSEDPVCNFERYLFEHEETGDKTVVNLLQVDEFDSPSAGTYTAYKYTATCVPQNFGGDAQDKLKIEAQYTITSEATPGTVTYDAETGVAQFTPA